MNDKGKSRKLDEYKSGPVPAAGPRGSQSTSLPAIGRPNMVHPHPNYNISPAESFHSAGGRLYSHGGLTQLMQMNRVQADLGPPLFMPALNLGTPKQPVPSSGPAPSSAGSTAAMSSSSNSISKQQKSSLQSLSAQPQQQIMNTSSPYATDMMSYPQHTPPISPYHQAPPMKPVPYISPTSAPIPKPTPISMVTQVPPKNPISRVMSGGSVDKHVATPSNKPLSAGLKQGSQPPGASDGVVKGEGLGGVISQQFQSGGRYLPPTGPDVMSSSSNSSNSVSKILSTSAPQQFSEASMPSGMRNVSSYSAVLNDVYSSRSPAVAPVNPTTSGQPSSNNVLADTRMDRPPQPSAPIPLVPTSSSTSQKELKDLQQQRLTTAEVASSIIISNPGLTGKHIAAMTNTTQQLPPPSTLYHPHHPHHQPHPSAMAFSSSTSSITSPSSSSPNPLVQGDLMPPTAVSVMNLPPGMAPQQMSGVDVGGPGSWSYPSQHLNSNHHMYPAAPPTATPTPGSPLAALTSAPMGHPAPPTVSMASKDLLTQQHSNGFKPRLEPSTMPQSPLAGGGIQSPLPGGGVQSTSMDIGLLTSPVQATNSSPRPRILRGKRTVDGGWKLDGQSNPLHSPGSPHKSKLLNLKKTMNSPCSGTEPPISPSSTAIGSTEHTGHFNHVTSVARSDGLGAELFGSPRKKPRKQNVVANDDQYASNVPDTRDDLASSTGSLAEVKGHQLHGSASELGGEMSREKEVCYLAQLRRSQYPINGVYKLNHLSALNHFNKYSDVKPKEALPVSPYELANDRSAHHRASGWKLQHFSSQMQEQVAHEESILALMDGVKSALDAVEGLSTSLLDQGALASTKELLQGNIDRSNRISSHIVSTRSTMFSVLDHRPQVMDILDKYSNFKSRFSSISPSLSSSSSSHPPRSH